MAPATLPVRPTTDFAKEALFNILNNHFDFESIHVLDLFAGTGNISYEFASRNALSVLAVDSNQDCTSFIAQTALKLEFHQLQAMRSDALGFIQKCNRSWDVIFADPPFDFDLTAQIPDLVIENNLLNEDGLFVLEHSVRHSFELNACLVDQRRYGAICFSMFRKNPIVV